MLVTPVSSVAAPETVIVPETVAPEMGLAMETVGGVESVVEVPFLAARTGSSQLIR